MNGNGAALVAGEGAGSEAAAGAVLAATAVASAEPKINRRCKRRRRELLEASG